MIQFATIFKIIKVLAIIGGVIAIIIVPLVNGVIYGFQSGDWSELSKATGGLIFASDQTIKENVNILSNSTLLEAYPEKFDKKYVDHLKTEIIIALMVIIAWIIFFFWLFSKILGEAGRHALSIIIFIIPASIFAVALMEFIYSLAIPSHIFIIPFQGLWDLAWNWEIWTYAGEEITLNIINNTNVTAGV